jgi:hypothetical protein
MSGTPSPLTHGGAPWHGVQRPLPGRHRPAVNDLAVVENRIADRLPGRPAHPERAGAAALSGARREGHVA